MTAKTIDNVATAVLVAFLVLPFGYAFLSPDGRDFLLPPEPPLRSVLFNWAFWLYALPTYALSAFIITRSGALSRRDRIIWLAFTLLLFPIAIWFLLARLYWRGDDQIPRNLEDQRRILRENVERLKADRE